jgi:hypothetical protein
MIEAMKYASQYIKNSETGTELLLTSLKDYAVVKKIITKVLPDTTISAPAIEVTNPNKDDYIGIDSIEWEQYFSKKDDILNKNITFNVTEDEINLDLNFLTTDLIKKYSIVNDGKLEAKELFYSNDVEFDIKNIFLNDGNVLSFKEAKQIGLLKDEPLKIDKLNTWDIEIDISGVKVTNNNSNYIKVDGMQSEDNKLLLKHIVFPNGQYSKEKLKKDYIGKDKVIDKYAQVPEDAEHNILTIKDIANPDKDSMLPLFKKINDKVRIVMEEEQDFALLSSSIDDNIGNSKTNELFFENGNYLIQKRNLAQTVAKIIASYQD